MGSLALRCRKGFESSRKLGRSHQNILIFVKGDPKKATDYLGAPKMVDYSADEGDELEVLE